MASIERTAYPRFARLVSERDLDDVAPDSMEIEWAKERTRSDASLLGLVLSLKCFEKLGYFPKREAVPEAVVSRVRLCLDLNESTPWGGNAERTAKRHRAFVRGRLGVRFDPDRSRQVAADAMQAAASTRSYPPDLINVALEGLVKESLELPGYDTLDEICSQVRAGVNAGVFRLVVGQMSPADRTRLLELLEVDEATRKSSFDDLKRPAVRASWSGFREQITRVNQVAEIGRTDEWFAGVAASKVSELAAEAAVEDATRMREIGETKRIALVAALAHVSGAQARDDLTEMFCKRIATVVKRAKTQLEETRQRHQAITERLISNYRALLFDLEPDGQTADNDPAVVLDTVRRSVENLGGFDAEYENIELVTAFHGNSWVSLVDKYWRRDRSSMYRFVEAIELEATSADRAILDAIQYAVACRDLNRDLISNRHGDGREVDLSFMSQAWQLIVRDSDNPGLLNRRHFEAATFVCLAEDLRTGNVAVVGSDAYANWADRLLSWEDCEPLLAEFCDEAGIPGSAEGFVEQLQQALEGKASEVDRGYPANTDLVIDESGRPSLKRRRRIQSTTAALELEELVKGRMPERSLLEILARTAYWLSWWRRFGPPSGSDPKLADPLLRYVLTAFAYGCNLGPYETARHIREVSAHELLKTGRGHFDIDKLNRAIGDIADAYMDLDLIKLWGDGRSVGADGTQIDTYANNVLAQSHIRYGGYGGIAYHHVADTYIALFSRFVPCGAWEAIYIIEGLLDQESSTDPDTIHADTHGQSFPVHALAHLLGFDLLPRIRNWKELIFYRPTAQASYDHIDSLFGTKGRNVIDWKLIETHWIDLMRVAISIQAGEVSSSMLLQRLTSESLRNSIYRAFREVGRVVRTITLLRYISDPSLRTKITAVTNKVEAYNEFSQWLRFGHETIKSNDPQTQEKIVKYNTLVADCVIFHTALDMTEVIRTISSQGHSIDPEHLALTSPYIREKIRRFGDYDIAAATTPPDAFNPRLGSHLHTPQASVRATPK